MLLGHEGNSGLGTDALVIVCFWNTNGVMLFLVAGPSLPVCIPAALRAGASHAFLLLLS